MTREQKHSLYTRNLLYKTLYKRQDLHSARASTCTSCTISRMLNVLSRRERETGALIQVHLVLLLFLLMAPIVSSMEYKPPSFLCHICLCTLHVCSNRDSLFRVLYRSCTLDATSSCSSPPRVPPNDLHQQLDDMKQQSWIPLVPLRVRETGGKRVWK